MNENGWIVVLTGIVGVLSGLVGQAVYWGIFKGSIEARTEATEGNISKLEKSRSEMWDKINNHAERIASAETELRALKRANG